MVAAITLVTNVIDRIKRANADQVIKWQRTIIYSLIRNGYTQFDEIKLHYLAAAQQVDDLRVPKSEIQDGALNLILLSLQEAGLISITPEGDYLLNVAEPPNEIKKQMEALAFEMFRKQQTERKIRSRIYEVLEAQPATYTIDALHRHFTDNGFELEFDLFNLAVRELLARREIYLDDRQKLHAGSPVHTVTVPTGQERTVRPGASTPTRTIGGGTVTNP